MTNHKLDLIRSCLQYVYYHFYWVNDYIYTICNGQFLIDVIKIKSDKIFCSVLFCFIHSWFSIEVAVCLVNKSCSRDPSDSTKLYFFYGPNYFDHKIFNYNELQQILKDEKYDSNRSTTLYMHGYAESMGSETVHRIVNAYLLRKEHNIIVLDWSDAASGNYFINAVPNAMTVIEIWWVFFS